MSEISQTGEPVLMTIEAVIIRADGTREDQGIVSYWHKNPLRRLHWRLTHRR